MGFAYLLPQSNLYNLKNDSSKTWRSTPLGLLGAEHLCPRVGAIPASGGTSRASFILSATPATGRSWWVGSPAWPLLKCGCSWGGGFQGAWEGEGERAVGHKWPWTPAQQKGRRKLPGRLVDGGWQQAVPSGDDGTDPHVSVDLFHPSGPVGECQHIRWKLQWSSNAGKFTGDVVRLWLGFTGC